MKYFNKIRYNFIRNDKYDRKHVYIYNLLLLELRIDHKINILKSIEKLYER